MLAQYKLIADSFSHEGTMREEAGDSFTVKLLLQLY